MCAASATKVAFHIENLFIQQLFEETETPYIDPIKIGLGLQPHGPKYPNKGVLGLKDYKLNGSGDPLRVGYLDT